ncbi:MAG: hypothetical protein QM642_06815 [Edaphocola sp.]
MSYENNGRKPRSNFNKTRGTSGAFMGLLYCLLALFFAFCRFEGTLNFIGGNKALAYILLTLMFAYGVFRIYRGVKMIKEEE